MLPNVDDSIAVDVEQARPYLRWEVDSAAIIGFHSGKSPDRRALSTLKKFGITDYVHKARVATTADIREFDYIFGMDDSNISDLRDLEKQTNGKAIVELLGKYDPQGHRTVPDPYYESGDEMFEQVGITIFESEFSTNPSKIQEMSCPSSYVMYLVLRRDLMSSQGWPLGAVCTQAAHAASAAMWLFRNDPNTIEYTKELDSMRKVTLGVQSEAELLEVRKSLERCDIDHKVWIEDGQSVCIALKPYRKEHVKDALKGLSLF
uniref:LMWPc domain-containing protein n=1 Tax=Angiostrongylus cantonensis TaxID=6313 RepID=A0A0K0DJA9_ANGCA